MEGLYKAIFNKHAFYMEGSCKFFFFNVVFSDLCTSEGQTRAYCLPEQIKTKLTGVFLCKGHAG